MTTSTINDSLRGVRSQHPIIVDLITEVCIACGAVFGIEAGHKKQRQADHQSFYCPNGHSMVYTGETEEQKLRRRLEHAEDRYRREVDHRKLTERQLAAAKGRITRIKNRIANGVCPVPGCKRSGFDDVMKHIHTVHPNYVTPEE